MLYTNDQVYQHNADDTWSQAVPLPLYGLRKTCGCGRSFWREKNYIRHYQLQHTDGIAYERTPQGLVPIDRRFHFGEQPVEKELEQDGE